MLSAILAHESHQTIEIKLNLIMYVKNKKYMNNIRS